VDSLIRLRKHSLNTKEYNLGGYIMNYSEMRKAFEQMLENIDVKIFLKASPLESGERSKLDKVLSNDMYYESLYAHSDKAEKLIKEIKEKMTAEDTHNFILSGYKGCGKSTFVGYFLRNVDARSLVINFDDYWEPREGIYHNIVMFIYNKILDDFYPNEGKLPCKISKKYNEIFHDTMNGEFIESHIDLHDFFTYFTHKLSHVVWLREQNKYSKEHVKQKMRDHVKEHIKSGSLSNLLMLLVFWDVADRIVNQGKPQCYIVFENLDVIHNTKDVPELVKNIVAFRNNIDKITESIHYQGQPICDPTRDYVLMLVMRETTKAEFTNSIDHFSDRKIRFQHFMAVSQIYDLYEIISTRYRYLESIKKQYVNNQGFLKMLQSIANIKTILANPVVRERIFAIFNNDYRTCVEALDRFGFSDPKIIGAHSRLIHISSQMPSDENWPVFGCRSIVFRHIFNSFVNDVFFKMVRKYEYSISDNGRVGSVNLDRMILLYLNNSQNIMMSEEMEEREYIPLNVLYLEILKFCKKPETIVEAIWNMYDLQNTEIWNHLVTFDDMRVITISELQNEMDAVIGKKEDFNFAKIKITLAGQVYLNYILPHFEYYTARSELGKGYSLFCSTMEELCNIRRIEKIIKNERKEVSECCKRLYLFFAEVFDQIDEFKGKNFLDTKFASIKMSSTKKSVSRMYHCEKIIYSNIGYLDSFRFFVFYSADEVVRNGGFNTDVDITDIVNKVQNFNKSFKEQFPEDFYDCENKRIVLKRKRAEQVVEVYKTNGNIKRCVVSIDIIMKTVKVCYNKSIIDSIIELLKLFGFYNGVQSAKYSNGTNDIFARFDACINHNIIPSKYEDFVTQITYGEGERILIEEKRKEKKIRQEKRASENLERKRRMGLLNSYKGEV